MFPPPYLESDTMTPSTRPARQIGRIGLHVPSPLKLTSSALSSAKSSFGQLATQAKSAGKKFAQFTGLIARTAPQTAPTPAPQDDDFAAEYIRLYGNVSVPTQSTADAFIANVYDPYYADVQPPVHPLANAPMNDRKKAFEAEIPEFKKEFEKNMWILDKHIRAGLQPGEADRHREEYAVWGDGVQSLERLAQDLKQSRPALTSYDCNWRLCGEKNQFINHVRCVEKAQQEVKSMIDRCIKWNQLADTASITNYTPVSESVIQELVDAVNGFTAYIDKFVRLSNLVEPAVRMSGHQFVQKNGAWAIEAIW